jgi:hypothetical protein
MTSREAMPLCATDLDEIDRRWLEILGVERLLDVVVGPVVKGDPPFV